MKTSVTKIMMSLALMGCLIFSASDAMAQGRSRSQGGSTSSRSQSAAVSRSSSSTAPSVSRNTDRSAAVSRSSSTSAVSRSSTASVPQVNRSSSSSSSSMSRGSVATASPKVDRTTSSAKPQVNRSTDTRGNSGSSVTTTRGNSSSRTNSGATTRGNSNSIGISKSTGKVAPHNDTSGRTAIDRTATKSSTAIDSRSEALTKTAKNHGGKDRNGDNLNNGRGAKDRNGSNMDNDRGGSKDSNGKGHNDRSGNKDRGGKGHNGDNGKHGDNRGYNPKNRYDYTNHHYRDEFSRNFSTHNWSRPLPPPARPHRPAPWVWHRPVVPAGWHPYASAPVIDRILDIVFGTYYFESLNHLYCNGYYIDGYADDVIYLRDVPMLGLYWSDAMLNYSNNRFANAQFVYYSSRYDDARYNILINKLTRIYGLPVCRDGVTVSWYGSDGIGYVTLSMMNDPTGYYTTMSIGY